MSAAAPPARILSISGDPAIVALSARVLAVLEQRTGQPVSALFHLIVGEGAGAALALLLGLAQTTPDQRPPRPVSAEAAAPLLAEGLRRPRRAPLGLAFGLGETAEPSLTTATSPLALAELSAAVTDLAVPVFDTAQARHFLFRSWKAQGLYPRAGEGRGRHDFRGHDILRAALRHPATGPAAVQARSRLGFEVAGGGALARDPVSLASLLGRQLYQRAGSLLILSLNFAAPAPAPTRARARPDRAQPFRADNAAFWDRQGQSVLNQLTARGMAERLITLELPLQPGTRYSQRGGGEAALDAALQAVLKAEEANGFRGLCQEFARRSAVGHTALRTPMWLPTDPSDPLSRPWSASGQARI
ncbi:MAG: hypothetical protein VX077_00850 [Pseudomonadota bacterium]|nr:hypothetical protein [Pseudomonadota bacterium]